MTTTTPTTTRAPSALALRRQMAAEREALALELEAMGPAPAPRPAAPARLLLLSCSATKSAAPGRVPVRERYRGPLWLTLGTVDPAGQLAQLVAVSAALGFVPAWHEIPTYEARLTVATGEAVAAEIAAGCPGLDYRARGTDARRRHALAKLAAGAVGEFAFAARAAGRPLEAVALCGGRAYLAPMRAAVAVAIARGHVAASATITVINASIGHMRRQLREWLTGQAAAPVELVEAVELVAVSPVTAPPAVTPAPAIGHNGGPPLVEAVEAVEVVEAAPVSPVTSHPSVTPPAGRVAHLAQLHQAEARAQRQVAEILAGGARQVVRAVARYEQAAGPWHFFPSRLARNPSRRADLAEVAAAARAPEDAKRAGQLAQLAAKLERIRAAIAVAGR